MSAVDDHAARAYDALAPYYDTFTAHHDYDAWTADLERLALRAGLRGRRLLDVACGTGKSFLPFLRRGYAVTACDVAPRMLVQARAKAGGGARIEQHDMRRLPVLGQFDLVCILDDAVNYLDDREELEAALRGVARNLAPDGVLLFDANALLAYRTFFASASVVRGENLVIVWDGQARADFAEGDRCEAELLGFEADGHGAWRLTRSLHRQRHHPRPTVAGALRAAGFAWWTSYGMKGDGSVSAEVDELRHTKAVYVARRTPAPA